MHKFFVSAFVLVMAALSGTAQAATRNTDAQGFFDDFIGGLVKGRWYVSDGWTNGDWQDCFWSASAVKVQDGILNLSHIPRPGKDGPPAFCGELQTTSFLQYGTFEARIRTPRGSGLNASVFTYTGPIHKNPHDEIDIEILSRDPATMTMNTFVAGQAQNGGDTPVTPPLDEAFHTVGFRWAPDGIIWFLDGREVHRTAPGTPIPNHPQKLFMSFWSSATFTDWMGKQTARDTPLNYEIDWVGYTPLGASCLFPASITCKEQ